jgi:hypothetical protein
MPRYRCSAWTGPTGVVRLGRLIRRAGLRTPIIGTERVYIDVKALSADGARWNILATLRRKYGRDFGLRPACTQRRS